MRINQILQYSRNDFLFKFREKTTPIFLSLNPQSPIIFTSEISHPRKKHKTPFSAVLSKYLIDSQIEDVSAIPLERIIVINFNRRDIKGTIEKYHLFIELIPKAANAVLTDDQKKIIVSFSYPQQEGRSYTQGTTYILPDQQNKYNPFTITQNEFEKLLSNTPEVAEEITKTLTANILGFSPMISQEVHCISQHEETSLWQTLKKLRGTLSEGKANPNIYAPKSLLLGQNLNFDEKQLILSPISLQSLKAKNSFTFNYFNQAASEYYDILINLKEFSNYKKQLSTALNNRNKRIKRLTAKLQKEYEESEKGEKYKQFGELLLSNLKRIKPAEKSVTLINYYDPDQQEITIQLNPNLTAQENAQKYFTKYNKAKRSRPFLIKRRKKLEQILASLKQIKTELSESAQLPHLASIEKKLAAYDIKMQKASLYKMKSPDDKVAKYRQFTTSDNLQVLVGKDEKTNEYVTFKLASDNDFWLHAAGYSGSHVVVRNPSKMNKLPERSLIESAQIAAYFSKARSAGRALVHYTQRKYVKKTKGKKAGKVLLRNYRTISVQPRIPDSVMQL